MGSVFPPNAVFDCVASMIFPFKGPRLSCIGTGAGRGFDGMLAFNNVFSPRDNCDCCGCCGAGGAGVSDIDVDVFDTMFPSYWTKA